MSAVTAITAGLGNRVRSVMPVNEIRGFVRTEHVRQMDNVFFFFFYHCQPIFV